MWVLLFVRGDCALNNGFQTKRETVKSSHPRRIRQSETSNKVNRDATTHVGPPLFDLAVFLLLTIAPQSNGSGVLQGTLRRKVVEVSRLQFYGNSAADTHVHPE